MARRPPNSGSRPSAPAAAPREAAPAAAPQAAGTEAARAAVTLRDVARLAAVHISTASRALDPEQPGRIAHSTVERVRAAAEELDYTPDLVASGLKRRRTQSISVIVAELDNPYSGLLIRGLSRALEEHGFVALVAESAEDPRRLARLLQHAVARRADAIAVTAAHAADGALLRSVLAHAPVVLGVRDVPDSGLPAIIHDDGLGAELAVRHLQKLGHRIVAQLPGPLDVDTFRRRDDGFRRTAVEAGMQDVTPSEPCALAKIPQGRRLMALTLGREPRPTAVFAHNDLLAIGALEGIVQAGLQCPRDVSVVGYNDSAVASHLATPLTTVRVSSEQLGRRLAEALLERIEVPALPPETTLLTPALVERATTAPPPGRRRRIAV